MVLWETQLRYKDIKTKKIGQKRLHVDETEKHQQREWETILRDLNKDLGINCDPDSKISAYVVEGTEGNLHFIIAHQIKNTSLSDCFDFLKDMLLKNYAVSNLKFEETHELSGLRFDQLGERGYENGFISRWHAERRTLGLDYFDNSSYKVDETLEENVFSTLADAKKAAADIMMDQSLSDELGRIYSEKNQKSFFGNPVHYKITASTSKAAMDMVHVLVPALVANHRLCGSRILRIHDITEGCYEEKDFEHLFQVTHGNVVVIETSGSQSLHGNYADAYQRVIEFMDSVIGHHHIDTLCIFVEIRNHSGFADSLLAKVRENLFIVELFEGYGDRKQAIRYLKSLAKTEAFSLSDTALADALPDKEMFSVEDIFNVYGNLFKNGLRTHIYKAYEHCAYISNEEKDKESAPYDELQNMIGLGEIKQLVDAIIDAGKIRQLRTEMGLQTSKASLHMVFTGNPGSAKTTVARLIAQILRKENILSGGNFVECGRADLIAKYVGWTARQVRSKFREAKGGILFIDEAYSLVDNSHSFADEAINTIVQEMENHRDDVIVIFAGYPDKMKEFLDKNEGLRSRIAFHLDFPDYTADELSDILLLMAEKQGYTINKPAVAKCRKIFEAACGESDFGNGRFVRNLLEQAQMQQSRRLSAGQADNAISKKALMTLKAEDFDVNVAKQFSHPQKTFGFAG
ncbi:MAG: AAA family ATPase [Lachnospiraceae bacterium]|nr:AAA family ATPase [Lachnospiraceae bacterium]